MKNFFAFGIARLMGSEMTSSTKENLTCLAWSNFKMELVFGGLKSHFKIPSKLTKYWQNIFFILLFCPQLLITFKRFQRKRKVPFWMWWCKPHILIFSHRSDFEDGFSKAFESGSPNKLINFYSQTQILKWRLKISFSIQKLS